MATTAKGKPIEPVWTKGRGGRKPLPRPVRSIPELAAAVRCDLTIPIVFLMLASRLSPSVKAYPHSRDPAKWCFRLGMRTIVELTVDGDAEWIAGPADLRPDIEILIACARQRHAELAGRFPTGTVVGSQDSLAS